MTNALENPRTYAIYGILLLLTFLGIDSVFVNAPSVFFQGIVFPAFAISIGLLIMGGILFFTGIGTPVAIGFFALGGLILVGIPITDVVLRYGGQFINALIYETILEGFGV